MRERYEKPERKSPRRVREAIEGNDRQIATTPERVGTETPRSGQSNPNTGCEADCLSGRTQRLLGTLR